MRSGCHPSIFGSLDDRQPLDLGSPNELNDRARLYTHRPDFVPRLCRLRETLVKLVSEDPRTSNEGGKIAMIKLAQKWKPKERKKRLGLKVLSRRLRDIRTDSIIVLSTGAARPMLPDIFSRSMIRICAPYMVAKMTLGAQQGRHRHDGDILSFCKQLLNRHVPARMSNLQSNLHAASEATSSTWDSSSWGAHFGNPSGLLGIGVQGPFRMRTRLTCA